MAIVSYIPTSKLMSLISAADPQKDLNVRVLNATRLSLETDTFQPIAMIDLSEEKVIAVDSVVVAQPVMPKATRKKSEYSLVAFGEAINAYSLKELLGVGLRALENKKPGTLDKLSKIKNHTKRIVAHEPALLFDTPGLSEKFAMKLVDGWWYGTNNSSQETEAWLKRACECAGVVWGSKDFSTDL